MQIARPISQKWDAKLAYAIGIIATDGNLARGSYQMNVTSKDYEIVNNVRIALDLTNNIGKKARGHLEEKKYYVLQFRNKNFYYFLHSIGLRPAKSKTLGELKIPKKFFKDFFRGCIDGDGTIGVFKHPESIRPQIRLRLTSASKVFLDFILSEVRKQFGIKGGWIHKLKDKSASSLAFGNADSLKLLQVMYDEEGALALPRKRCIADKILQGRVA